jgi:transcriptional regulator with XRE-family HTH domain
MDASATRLLRSTLVENERPSLEARAGRRVRELRQSRGWSQTDLATRLRPYGFDLTQSTVAKLEAGARPTRLDELDALAAALGVPLADFLRHPDEFGTRDEEVLEREVLKIEASLEGVRDKIRAVDLRIAAAAAERGELRALEVDMSAQLDEARVRLAEARGAESATEVS